METIRLITLWLPQGGGLNTEALEVPIGTIIAFMGNTPPENYLACDGNTYRIADYRPVANFINLQFGSFNYFGGDGVDTFAVPDLRGEFLRGTGANSHLMYDGITSEGSGASVGEHQGGTVDTFNGASSDNANFLAYYASIVPSVRSDWNVDSSLKCSGYRVVRGSSSSSGFNPNSFSYYTARPTNTSVLYCIKYKNS